MAMNYSLNYDVSCDDDGIYSLNFDYEDSEGISISKTLEGEEYLSLYEELAEEVIDEILYQQQMLEEELDESDLEEVDEEVDDYIRHLEKTIAELFKENASLKQDVDILQRRADDAVKDSKNTKKYNDRSTLSYNLGDILNSKKTSVELEKMVKDFYQMFK